MFETRFLISAICSSFLERLFIEETVSSNVYLAVLFLRPVPGSGWEDETALFVDKMLAPGAAVIASGSSTDVHRFLSSLHGMVLHGSRKYHGSRAVILKKAV